MTDEQRSLQPDVGIMVTAYYYANKYAAKVISHGKKYPKVSFRLRNGRQVEGYATIIEHDAPLPEKHRGYLCRMYHPTAYDR